MIIDVWGQHPTLRHIQDDIFAPLRRWTKGDFPTQELPVAATVDAMKERGIGTMLISARVALEAPRFQTTRGGLAAQAPDRLVGGVRSTSQGR
jgi:hypothetical protein